MRRLVTIDCGNTTIDVFRHSDGARRRFDARGSDVEELRSYLSASAATRCVAASVNDVGLEVLQRARSSLSVTIERAGIELPPPLPIDYCPQASLGVDRWVGALAAFRLHGASLVVDCGTATTFNLVDASGVFRGGAIGPGLRALLEGMHSATPTLPAARVDAPLDLPARSTSGAVDAGVQLGYAGAVDAIAAALLRPLDPAVKVVATGGNAARLMRHSRLPMLLEPTLVHRGLAMLADEPA